MRALWIFLSLTIQSNASSDWWKWRGPKGDGTWDLPGIAKKIPQTGLRRVWKIPLSPGYSGVTARDGRIYTMDRPPSDPTGDRERVLCVNAKSGKSEWEYAYAAKYGNLDYGKGPRASLTIFDSKVFGLGAMGRAFCLAAETGKLRWSRNLAVEEKIDRPNWGFSSSPEPFEGVILYHVGDRDSGNLLALDPENGRTLWRAGDDEKAGYAPPLIVHHQGGRHLVCWGPNKIMGLPIGGGSELWSVPYEVKYGVSIAKPIFEDGILLVCGYWKGSRAISLEEAQGQARLLWAEEEKIKGLMSQPLYSEGVCYLLDRSHGLTAFRLRTGEILWRDGHRLTPEGRNPQCSLVWTDKGEGEVLALNAEGELVFLGLSPQGCREYWREQVVGRTWAHPAYSERRIYARDDRSLVCWELP